MLRAVDRSLLSDYDLILVNVWATYCQHGPRRRIPQDGSRLLRRRTWNKRQRGRVACDERGS